MRIRVCMPVVGHCYLRPHLVMKGRSSLMIMLVKELSGVEEVEERMNKGRDERGERAPYLPPPCQFADNQRQTVVIKTTLNYQLGSCFVQ